MTVSYTHLDVYKRQPLDWMVSSLLAAAAEAEAAVLEAVEAEVLEEQPASERTPVSYTHLDVYKRQPVDCPMPMPMESAPFSPFSSTVPY